jgi:hypothetical protein
MQPDNNLPQIEAFFTTDNYNRNRFFFMVYGEIILFITIE